MTGKPAMNDAARSALEDLNAKVGHPAPFTELLLDWFQDHEATIRAALEAMASDGRDAEWQRRAEWVQRQPDPGDSCLLCGRIDKPGAWSALYPRIYVCVKCRDAACGSPQDNGQSPVRLDSENGAHSIRKSEECPGSGDLPAPPAPEQAKDAARYRWLRDKSLMVLQPGPICVAADKWGKPHMVDDSVAEPGVPITLDGAKLDAAIDDAMKGSAEHG